MDSHSSALDLVPDVIRRKRRSVARAITIVENGLAGAEDLVDALFPHTGNAWRIGITGPPGAGKSTLTDRLIGRFRDEGKLVAVVAVDPSSPFTGGALLGDRVRMDSRTGDNGVFMRSLAARGALGGLSEATEAACDVLDAAGFDVILIETVGVGQGELDVAQATDTVLVVLVPQSGDAVQAMKAGLMEIADVFAVNKADHPEAPAMVRALRQTLHLRPPAPSGWMPRVDKASALEDTGIGGVMESLHAHRAFLEPTWQTLRIDRLRRRVQWLVEESWRRSFWTLQRRVELASAIQAMDASERAPYRLAAVIKAAGV